MPKIKIKDLPKNAKISKDEMKKIVGGTTFRTSPDEKSVVIRPQPRRRIGYPDK